MSACVVGGLASLAVLLLVHHCSKFKISLVIPATTFSDNLFVHGFKV